MLFGNCKDLIDGQKLSYATLEVINEVLYYEIGLENLLTFGLAKTLNLSPTIKRLKEKVKRIEAAILKRYQKVYNQETGKEENSFLGNMAVYNKQNTNLEDQISAEDIVGSCAVFVFAAFDTTRHSTSWAMNFLKENPKIQNQIFNETCNIDLQNDPKGLEKLDYCTILDMFVKETLRLGAPFMFSEFREFKKNCKIGNFNFKKGDQMMLGLGMNTTKESKFDRALEFNINRFEKGKKPTWERMDYIPFSSGRRGCIG